MGRLMVRPKTILAGLTSVDSCTEERFVQRNDLPSSKRVRVHPSFVDFDPQKCQA